jgi:multidrug transporter EmrE-like cation transporter
MQNAPHKPRDWTRSSIALILSITFGVAGQLLLKLAALRSVGGLFAFASLTTMAVALAVYSAGILAWIVALRGLPLGIAYPVTSLSYVGILWGSWYWFGEDLSPARLLGVLLIFAGVVMVALPPRQPVAGAAAPAEGRS